MKRAVFAAPLLSLALAVPVATLTLPGEAMAQSCPRGEVFRDRKCQPLEQIKKNAPPKDAPQPPKDARHRPDGPRPDDHAERRDPPKGQPPRMDRKDGPPPMQQQAEAKPKKQDNRPWWLGGPES